jgi:glutathione synthase/RimK-type ligase-like ATP-grasp enzyme
MQTGDYIIDRLLPGMIRQLCDSQGIVCESMSQDWVFRLSKAEDIRWILGYKFDLNTAAASGVAQDKVATYEALTAAQIQAVPHILLRSVPHESIAVANVLAQLPDGAVVAKPLDGTGGRDVIKFEGAKQAIEFVREQTEPAWALSPYIALQQEFRIIMLDGEVLLAYEKTQPTIHHNELKFFNLGMGAIAVNISDNTLKVELTIIAQSVMKYLSLRLAAVDIVQTEQGKLVVLEVNDGIMMENYARQSAEYTKSAVATYDAIINAMFH